MELEHGWSVGVLDVKEVNVDNAGMVRVEGVVGVVCGTMSWVDRIQ